MSYLTQAIGAAKLALKANGPTLMVGGGIVAMGAGTILACKQTLKVEEVLSKHTPDLENIERAKKTAESSPAISYSKEDSRSDRIKVYTRAGLELGKVYAIPVVLWTGGATLVFGGHRMMAKRNATLALAYTGLKKAFDKYRERVRNEFGSEVDQAMYSGYKIQEFTDPVTGEVKTANVRDWDASAGDPYNRIFEQGATSAWEPDLGVNRMFIANQQRFAQQLLNRRKYLWLSEVYECLGFPENDISRVVGWKVRTNPDGSKDIPFVDFGLDKPHPDDWKFSKENAIYLDFNTQGLIVGGKIQKILEQA
jgi:hypothetical protein